MYKYPLYFVQFDLWRFVPRGKCAVYVGTWTVFDYASEIRTYADSNCWKRYWQPNVQILWKRAHFQPVYSTKQSRSVIGKTIKTGQEYL